MKSGMKIKRILILAVLPLLMTGALVGFINKSDAKATDITPAAEGAGIEFFHGNFAEAKAIAKSQNKLIFVDAYTTWCGPCRLMASQTFTQPSVGEYFNKNFVNLKMDMESGEGVAFGSQYKVMAYPTLLFLDHTGAVKGRALGAKPAAELINVGKDALAQK